MSMSYMVYLNSIMLNGQLLACVWIYSLIAQLSGYLKSLMTVIRWDICLLYVVFRHWTSTNTYQQHDLKRLMRVYISACTVVITVTVYCTIKRHWYTCYKHMFTYVCVQWLSTYNDTYPPMY